MRSRLVELLADFEMQAIPVMATIAADLEAEAPDAEDYEWPEPEPGDEDADALFDSRRAYLDQIARYREHQGKGEIRFKTFANTCANPKCGEAFTSRQRAAMFCSEACRKRDQRRRAKASVKPERRRRTVRTK